MNNMESVGPTEQVTRQEEARRLTRELMGKYGPDFYEAFNKKADILIEKYGDKECRKYEMFHIVSVSTYKKENCPYWDFPGEDSIELFLKNYK